jgi:hypothetical protein
MNNLDKILDEYHKYLIDRKLVKKVRAPYLVRRVREFLQFARDKTGRRFETVIEMFKQRLSIHHEGTHRTQRKGNGGLFVN